MPRRDIPSPATGKRLKTTSPWRFWIGFNASRRPPPRKPGSAPALVEPPRGPLPLEGGAAAPLEYDD